MISSVSRVSARRIANTVARRAASTAPQMHSQGGSGLPPQVKATLAISVGGFALSALAMSRWYYQNAPMTKIFREGHPKSVQ